MSKAKRQAGSLRREDLGSTIALADCILLVSSRAHWPLNLCARVLVEQVAEILAARGLVRALEYEGRWIPIFENGTSAIERRLVTKWVGRLDRHELKTDALEQELEQEIAPDGRRRLKLSRSAGLLSETFCRSIVRDVLIALGVPTKRASDLLPGVDNKRERDRVRQLHDLASFAHERLTIGGAGRSTGEAIYQAYRDWRSPAGLTDVRPLTRRELTDHLKKSRGARPFKAGVGGRRLSGWRGIGLKPEAGKPGVAARAEDERFLSYLVSADFPKDVERARRSLKKKRGAGLAGA